MPKAATRAPAPLARNSTPHVGGLLEVIGSRDQVDKAAGHDQHHTRPPEPLRCSTGTHIMLVSSRNVKGSSYIPHLVPLLPFLAAPLPYELFIRLIRSSGLREWAKRSSENNKPEPVSWLWSTELRRTPLRRSSVEPWSCASGAVSAVDRGRVSLASLVALRVARPPTFGGKHGAHANKRAYRGCGEYRGIHPICGHGL